jgi:nicotinate-nucleotide pyrophosphorylase (carboxylating)
MILIKDNHIDFAGGVTKALDKVQQYLQSTGKNLTVEIEVRTMQELQEVLQWGKRHKCEKHDYQRCGKEQISGLQRIMLDNFSPATLKEALQVIAKKYETEASGGITEKNLLDYAKTNVDFISIGALTHHIKALDLSLKAEG